MAAFHFIISPPAKKPVPRKVEKNAEEVPKLILAPFNSTPEINFGDVLVNSKVTKGLLIRNPSTASFVAHFGNIDSDDRIFINGCDIQLCEIHLEACQEIEIEVTWSPIHSGYLRKTVRIYNISKKAKSFDVVLRGMAVSPNNVKNTNAKKLKENKVIRFPPKNCNSTVTLSENQNKTDVTSTIRRQTYTINGKENLVPDDSQIIRGTVQSSSPIFPKELNSLNVLNENSVTANFTIQSFSSYDSDDAPAKYLHFKSELELSADTSGGLNPINTRRSTVSSSGKEDVNLSLPDKNYLMDFCKDSFLSNRKDGLLTTTDISTSVRSTNFSDSLTNEITLESQVENITFSVKSFPDADVFLTPQKNWDLESLISSPPSNLRDSLSFSKSTNCLASINGSSFKSYKRDDLFFISPPQKSLNKRCKKTPEDPFPHRSGSSAISDRKKLLKTNFLSRKRISPNSALKNRGPRRISAFGFDNGSTIEKVKNRNPQTLKQAVSSHCQINDPFLKQVLYNEDKWVEKQEADIIKWMNSVLVPFHELSEETNDYAVNAADIWLKSNRSDESSTISVSNNVPPLYSVPQKLNILRKRKKTMLMSEPVKSVFQSLFRIIDRKIIFVRDDRDLHADEGLKKKLLHLLSCYNPVWLRMGLEAVYDQEISLQPRADVGGLGLFIRKKLLSSALVNKRSVNSQPETMKKNILLAFLKLVYFLDQARMQKLIRHDRCLFTLTSNHKSSQDLLSAFCADLIVGRGYVMKHLKAINYSLQFKQTCVDEYDYRITSLDDLRDGIRLARLSEILFMEPDLCSKLRIPAIDIENKKHNVEVAMKVARSRCTIEGNIMAEDIVLGNRAGSRMKTLSFLWQIINNYLTPLYERAVTKIQKWWRIRRLHARLKNFVHCEKERKALTIQSAWRGYVVRKLFRNVIIERKQQILAALTIQRRFRAFLLMKQERTAFQKMVIASTVLQSWYRGMHARRKFVKLRLAAIIVQQRYRAFKLMTDYRRQFVSMKSCAVFLQRLRRANIAAHRQRTRYLTMRQAAVTIQQTYRRIKLFRAERSSYLALRMNLIYIQRKFRANRSTKCAREQFLALKNATIIIQCHFRSQRAMFESRNIYLRLKSMTIKIQRKFRANRLMRVVRANFIALKHSAIVLQRKFRATQLMKAERCRYLCFKRHVVNIQRLRRANNEAKLQRYQFLNLRRATIFIQRRFRANQAAKIQRCLFKTLKLSTVTVQRKFRANRAMKIERNRYVRLRETVIFIQRLFQADRVAKLIRLEYLHRRNATIFIQQKFRAQIAMKEGRQRYLLLRQSVLCVQRKFRANQLGKMHRNHFKNLVRSAIFAQRKFRANQLAKCEREQYIELRNSVVVLQKKLRAHRLMQVQRGRFLALKTSALTIQQRFRAYRVAKLQRSNYVLLREAVVFVQRKLRANETGNNVRREYLQLKTSVIFLQNRYRSLRLMRKCRSNFNELKSNVIKIQRIYRNLKLMREEKKKYEMLKTAAITLQRRYRARCLMQETRSHYLKLKNLTVAIQTRYIALRVTKVAGIRGANRQLSSSQITKIGPLQIQKFNVEQRNAFSQMLAFRAKFLKLKMTVLLVQSLFRMKMQRNRFLLMRNATIQIQHWWRSVRGRWLAIREVKENARRIERNAAIKIQALWRGYSVRKTIVLPAKSSTVPKKDKENPDSKGTLGERYKRAINHLKTSDMYNVITIALWNLETVTTFSAKLCEGVALEGIVPIIFSLVSRGNRSEPSIELYRASFSILINLARYAPTKAILWDNMDKDEDVMLILHIMKMSYDKFLKKNDIEVFRNSATLLWLLSEDVHFARRIASVNTLQVQLDKMMETLNRKCPCSKNPKSRRFKILPKTESNWYADPETRSFNDNCFALSCIYNNLFNR